MFNDLSELTLLYAVNHFMIDIFMAVCKIYMHLSCIQHAYIFYNNNFNTITAMRTTQMWFERQQLGGGSKNYLF